jgi:hypothetical protein
MFYSQISQRMLDRFSAEREWTGDRRPRVASYQYERRMHATDQQRDAFIH